MNGSEDQLHVLIIGAGSTGLLVAQGLEQAGISFEVFERTDVDTYQHRQRDWSMALHWGAEFLHSGLPPDISAKIRTIETDTYVELTEEQATFMPIYNGKTAELVANLPTASTRRVSREKLRKLLSTGINIRYASKLVQIVESEGKVFAHFEDGHVAVGDCIIGCDSAHSAVRTWLLGESVAAIEDWPMVIYNFAQTFDAQRAIFMRESLHPLINTSIHPDIPVWFMYFVMDRKDPDKPETWAYQLFFSFGDPEERDRSTSKERVQHLKSLADHYAEPFRSAILGVKDDAHITGEKFTHWLNPTRWDNHDGRITLAGDAAHPMLPYRGQGLNNALADAALYVDTLKKVLNWREHSASLADALKATIEEYDKEVFERGSREIALSAEQARRSSHWDEFTKSPIYKHGLNKS